MKTLQEIKHILATNKHKLFEKYPIQSLAIFGSFAQNKEKDESDLDLVVDFKERIGVQFIDLADELEDLLKIKVDLVSRKGIKDKYFKAIENDLIYV